MRGGKADGGWLLTALTAMHRIEWALRKANAIDQKKMSPGKTKVLPWKGHEQNFLLFS
jgi:hypothetical protein